MSYQPNYQRDGYGGNGYPPSNSHAQYPAHPQTQAQPQQYQPNAPVSYGAPAMPGFPQQSAHGQQQSMPFSQTAYGTPQYYDQSHQNYYQQQPSHGAGYQVQGQYQNQAQTFMSASLQQNSTASPSFSSPALPNQGFPNHAQLPQLPQLSQTQQPQQQHHKAQQYRSHQHSLPVPPQQRQQQPQSASSYPLQYQNQAQSPKDAVQFPMQPSQHLHQQSPRLPDTGILRASASPNPGSMTLNPIQYQHQHQSPQLQPSTHQSLPQFQQYQPPRTNPVQTRVSASPAPRDSPQLLTQQVNFTQPHAAANTLSAAYPQSVNAEKSQSAYRQVSHVEIPRPHASASGPSGPPAMAPPVKRRKSNEASPIPVYNPAPVSHSVQRVKAAAPPPSSSPLTELASSQLPPTPPSVPSVDYQATLLSLSDEYIKAAYSIGTSLASHEVPEDRLDEYYAYMATGMSCLESVLNNYRIPEARKEARIRLRLASLMYEETENVMEAEAILTKGIALCDRARLPDLKYAMHHLLARIWFKGNQARAAMKAVDKLIDDVEILQLSNWVYAFRFLRVTFGLQAENFHAEVGSLIKHISAIVSIADKKHDTAVQIVANSLEALVHLRHRTPECVDMAQRSLAAARTHQLSPEMEAMPHVRALLDCIDLACHLIRFNAELVGSKLSSLRTHLDAYYEDSGQSKEGNWLLPLNKLPSTSDDIEADTCGILRETPTGSCGLSLTWLTRTQATTLGLLLSAITGMHKVIAEKKPEGFLGDGISMNKVPLESGHRSLSAASAQAEWQAQMQTTLRAYAVFAYCARSDWENATKGVNSIRDHIASSGSQPNEDNAALVAYLEATSQHGLGNLQKALSLYRSPALELPPALDSKSFVTASASHIRVLAALNTVPILRKFDASQEADALLTRVEPICTVQTNSNGNEHGNRALESAFYVLKATELNMTIIKTKQYIQMAIQAAQKVTNDRLLTIVMNHMTHLFFANIVGRQAEQSAKVGRTLARKSGDRLWTAVADGMMSETFEKGGNLSEAEHARREGQQAMASLPASLRSALFDGGGGGS